MDKLKLYARIMDLVDDYDPTLEQTLATDLMITDRMRMRVWVSTEIKEGEVIFLHERDRGDRTATS